MKSFFFAFGVLAVAAALMLAAGAAIWSVLRGHIHRRRLRTWTPIEAEIASCSETFEAEDGIQEYTCTYFFYVADAREAGMFSFFGESNSLENVQGAFTGQTIEVLYNPANASQSIVRKSRIGDWDIWQ